MVTAFDCLSPSKPAQCDIKSDVKKEHSCQLHVPGLQNVNKNGSACAEQLMCTLHSRLAQKIYII